MAQYANNDFTSYNKEADLTKAVLVESSVPDNIKEVKMLHDFVKDILKEKGKQRDLDFDNIVKKIQDRRTSAVGSSKKWTTTETTSLAKENAVEVYLETIQQFFEQTVLL